MYIFCPNADTVPSFVLWINTDKIDKFVSSMEQMVSAVSAGYIVYSQSYFKTYYFLDMSIFFMISIVWATWTPVVFMRPSWITGSTWYISNVVLWHQISVRWHWQFLYNLTCYM